jgi:hypothetical protein
MKASAILAATVMTLVSGCQILEQFDKQAAKSLPPTDSCILVGHDVEQGQYCKVDIWLRYWFEVNAMTWPERKVQIENLSEEPVDTLKKVLLCQGIETPYQNRLRAQGWVTSLRPMLSDDMQQFVTVAIYQPSQELLELESALVTLSKISTNQANRVEEQELLSGQQRKIIDQQNLLLDQQKHQIEQLLKIESSIMDNTKGNKP